MSTVNSVDKAARILLRLARSGAATVADLSRDMELARSTVYKILVTMERHGFVERNPTRGDYHLGLRLMELGHRAQEETDLFAVVHPHLTALSNETGETVHFTVLDELEVLYVDCVESTRRLRTYSVIGVRAPLHATAVGKAILAYARQDLLDRLLSGPLERITDNTITDPAELLRELERTRERGYSVDDRENDPDIRCVGAPVVDSSGFAYASLSVSGPSERLTPERSGELGRSVIESAARIAGRAGALMERLASEDA